MVQILAFVEATTVTGPAKNLMAFHRRLLELGNPAQLEIATFPRGSQNNDFTRAAEALGISVHRISEASSFDRSVMQRMRSLIAERAPDIVQTHAIKSHFLLRFSGSWKLRPWIAFHHGYTYTTPRMRLYNQLDRWSLRRAAHVVTVSDAFARDLTRAGIPKDRISVLHNSIDAGWGLRARDPILRDTTRARLGIEPGDTALLIVGRLSREKSHVGLIEAVAHVQQQLPSKSLRLIIVGEGPEKAAIESAGRRLRCSEAVLLVGYTSDVLPYYAAADIAVLASITEGSPNALLEAMAAKVPVVATAVGGVPEIATDRQTALLVPPSDPEALATALIETIQNPEATQLRAVRAHQMILDYYTPERRAQRLLSLYKKYKGAE